MTHIHQLYNEWLSLQPLKPEDKNRLDRKFMLEFNYNSNHIEGNTLTYGQTELLLYNPQIQISAESETKRSIFREKDKTKRSKKESAQHSKSRNKSFVMTSVSAL